jgi:hypothetical protein
MKHLSSWSAAGGHPKSAAVFALPRVAKVSEESKLGLGPTKRMEQKKNEASFILVCCGREA